MRRQLRPLWLLRLFLISVMIMTSASFAYAGSETSGDKHNSNNSATTQTTALKTAWSIAINLPAFRLDLMRDGKPYRSYPIAIGKPTSQTPVGEFKVLNRVKNPTWYPPDGGKAVPPGPNNPLGSWWFGITKNGVGIHGNGKDHTIRTAASLGCIRMYDHHVTELSAYVTVGMPVTITYHLVEPQLAAEGWQIQVHNNVYKKPFPSAEEIAAVFAVKNIGNDLTDWHLVRALAQAAINGSGSGAGSGAGTKVGISAAANTLWLPVKSVLEMSPLSFDIYSTPDEVWIPLESAWAIIWLAGIGSIRPEQSLAMDCSKQAVRAGNKYYISEHALIEFAGGRFRIAKKEDHSGYAVVFTSSLAQSDNDDHETSALTQAQAQAQEQALALTQVQMPMQAQAQAQVSAPSTVKPRPNLIRSSTDGVVVCNLLRSR